MSLATSALALAISGIRVFPLVPGEKTPLTRHGFQDATREQTAVIAWWTRWPNANIGVPTGENFADILDVDNHGPDRNGYPALRRIRDHGLAAGAHRLVRTPSGGLHLHFRPCGNRNSTLPRQFIDLRGDGGYVVVPPSIVNGHAYEILEDRPAATGTLDWPAIRNLFSPPRTAVVGLMSPKTTGNVTALAAWLATAREGGRNCATFWACCRLAEAGAATLTEFEPLLAAAESTGLPRSEAERTALSAIRTVLGTAA